MITLDAVTAVNRLGLGARQGDLRDPSQTEREALAQQCSSPQAFLIPGQSLPDRTQAGAVLATYLRERAGSPAMSGSDRTMTLSPEAQQEAVAGPIRKMLQFAFPDVVARTHHAISTPNGFAERLVYFWSNHFTVAGTKALTLPYPGVFEREAIRGHLTGSFSELLLAVVRHPAMLLFLDQAQSIGPGSTLGKRRGGGLNENLAREILELHTVGVRGGYSQADVTELARALTGWTIAGERLLPLAPGATPGDSAFIAALHEPGARKVLGRSYAEAGEDQAVAILKDLARNPATGRHVAVKLATHFVADRPPPDLVEALTDSFIKTEGDLPSLHRILIDHPDTWRSPEGKFKSPNDFLVSSLRATGGAPPLPRQLVEAYGALGQVPFRAPSPAGWPDDAASWAGADSILKRLEWSQAYAGQVTLTERPLTLAQGALGPALSGRTVEAVQRSESAVEGLVLALMSPEFQRR